MKAGIIFPAFVNEYTGKESPAISVHKNNFAHYLKEASELIDIDLTGFDFQKNNFLNNELKSQCISYIFSCCVADILNSQKIRPLFVSGYSMGIYSASYYLHSITFAEGLLMVKKAWDVISTITAGRSFGMGMIIGLDISDIQKLLSGQGATEVCNQNNKHTFIISGELQAVENVVNAAIDEGALRTGILPVSQPYHSGFLLDTQTEFSRFINELAVSPPVFRYVSSIDQEMIETEEALRQEIIKNLFCKMNWYHTMQFMIENGTDYFFECGAGEGLTRNFRFIEGNFKSCPISKLDRFFEDSAGITN